MVVGLTRGRGAWARAAIVGLAGASLAACATTQGPSPSGLHGTMKPYQVGGVWYHPAAQPHYDETGYATWYGPESRYRTTADGERFDVNMPSAAHKTLPLPSIVEVTNLDNGKRIQVRVNDRGPFVRGRILDLSPRAAQELGFYGKGMARVRVRFVSPAPLAGAADLRIAAAAPAPAASIAPTAPTPPPPRAVAVSDCRTPVGLFAVRANADRAAAQAGAATIEPIERGGRTLWRVTLPCASEAGGAAAEGSR
jgi:rare lipoprotein A